MTPADERVGRPESTDRADISERFRRFAEDECRGSSPLYERLSLAAAQDDGVLLLMGEAPARQRRPNLLLAAVHYLLLLGQGGELRRFYPSLTNGETPAAGDPWPLFRSFCASHQDDLIALLRARATQTNEVRRSALLLPAFGIAARLFGYRPMAIVDVGASAGLNLLFDAYRYDYGEGRETGQPDSTVRIVCEVRGQQMPPIPIEMPRIARRVGLDQRPLDVCDGDDVRWLRACVWPEHRLRMRLLDAAIETVRRSPPRLVRGDAVKTLPELAAELPPSVPLCVVHTATLTYLSEPERDAFIHTVEALARDRDVVWVAFEGYGIPPAPAATTPGGPRRRDGVLSLIRFAGGDRHDHVLAHADMHGGWIEWLGATRCRG